MTIRPKPVRLEATAATTARWGISDRAFVFGLLALLLGLGMPAGSWLFYVEVLLIVLLGLTILNRARRALQSNLQP